MAADADDGKIIPLRKYVEDPDGGIIREIDVGFSYSITPDIWSMLTPAQRRALHAQEGTGEIYGGDDEAPE